MTLVFPDSRSDSSPYSAPPVEAVPIPHNLSATVLPSTSNPLFPISQDTTLVFAVPFSQADDFLSAVQEIPSTDDQNKGSEDGGAPSGKQWITTAGRGNGRASDGSFRGWAANAWTELLDLIKVRA